MANASPLLQIIQARSAADIAAVRAIFLEYLDFVEQFLGQSLGFQGTEAEFARFPDTYDSLFLAKLNHAPVAACAIKPFKDDICELKRLYCRPAGRGHNLGELLTCKAICDAKARGYHQIYLDTDPQLIHASKIYERLGFTNIDQYYENPLGCSRYMALTL